MKKIITLLLTSLIIYPAASSVFDPVDGQLDLGEYLADNAYGFLPIPIIITSPAIGYGGGVAGVFLHESSAQTEQRKAQAKDNFEGGAQLMTPAMTVIAAAGTTNGSWVVGAGHRRAWLQDKVRYMGGGGLGQGNINIYKNLGSNDTQHIPLSFETETQFIAVTQHLQYRLPDSNWFIGAKQLWSKSMLSSKNTYADGLINLTGLAEMNNSGLGLSIEYDNRNNLFFPTQGYSLKSDYMFYRTQFGADYNYDTFSFQGKAYYSLADKWGLAFAAGYEMLNSDALLLPPTLKPYIDLRGIAAYRFQGDQVITAQTQLSYRIDNRWTLLGFYGLGQTKNTSKSINNCKLTCQISTQERTEKTYAYGTGVRYQIARRYGLHIGIDLGFSEQEKALYFSLGSGF